MHIRTLSLAVALMVAAAACTADSPAPRAPSPTHAAPPASATPSPSSTPPTLTVESADFEDGGALEQWSTASAFGGQCDGDNRNPHLSWSGAPDATHAYAITMVDVSVGLYVHWVHVNIPADVTAVERGASESLAGLTGRHGNNGNGYLGPCPPSDAHEYVFTVWALDASLDFADGQSYSTFMSAAQGHVLATGTISGIYEPPAAP